MNEQLNTVSCSVMVSGFVKSCVTALYERDWILVFWGVFFKTSCLYFSTTNEKLFTKVKKQIIKIQTLPTKLKLTLQISFPSIRFPEGELPLIIRFPMIPNPVIFLRNIGKTYPFCFKKKKKFGWFEFGF